MRSVHLNTVISITFFGVGHVQQVELIVALTILLTASPRYSLSSRFWALIRPLSLAPAVASRQSSASSVKPRLILFTADSLLQYPTLGIPIL